MAYPFDDETYNGMPYGTPAPFGFGGGILGMPRALAVNELGRASSCSNQPQASDLVAQPQLSQRGKSHPATIRLTLIILGPDMHPRFRTSSRPGKGARSTIWQICGIICFDVVIGQVVVEIGMDQVVRKSGKTHDGCVRMNSPRRIRLEE